MDVKSAMAILAIGIFFIFAAIALLWQFYFPPEGQPSQDGAQGNSTGIVMQFANSPNASAKRLPAFPD